MKRFVLDACFTLHWCFEDEVTAATDAMLTLLQKQERMAVVPPIWIYEVLNGLGKGVARKRLTRERAGELWREIQGLPIELVDIPVDEDLMDLALKYNLAVYDASYFSLAMAEGLAIATGDGKLQQAAAQIDMEILAP